MSVAYYTPADTKPTVLYHGQTHLPILPYFGGQGPVDLENSGLDLSLPVDREAVARSMATLAVCLESKLPIRAPVDWVL